MGQLVTSHVLTLLVTTRLHFVFLHGLFLLLSRPPHPLQFRFPSRSSLQRGLFNNPSTEMSWCIPADLHCYLLAASDRTIKNVLFSVTSFSLLAYARVVNLLKSLKKDTVQVNEWKIEWNCKRYITVLYRRKNGSHQFLNQQFVAGMMCRILIYIAIHRIITLNIFCKNRLC